jgi:hypothetical protein
MIGSIAAAKHPPRLIYNLRRDSYELLNTQNSWSEAICAVEGPV